MISGVRNVRKNPEIFLLVKAAITIDISTEYVFKATVYYADSLICFNYNNSVEPCNAVCRNYTLEHKLQTAVYVQFNYVIIWNTIVARVWLIHRLLNTYMKVLPHDFPGESEENHEKLSRDSQFLDQDSNFPSEYYGMLTTGYDTNNTGWFKNRTP
jgi:hypothetical protein